MSNVVRRYYARLFAQRERQHQSEISATKLHLRWFILYIVPTEYTLTIAGSLSQVIILLPRKKH